MSDKDNGEYQDEEESFAELLESYDTGMGDDIRVGDKIRGEIISVSQDTVFVDTGTKIDGIVEKDELLDEDGIFPYEVGDHLELYAVSNNGNEIRLSRAISGAGGLDLLRDAYASGIPVEGKVAGPCKGGFHVEVMKRRAFCPISQMDLVYIRTPDDYTGQSYPFLVSQFEENGRNIVVSRRKLLEKEQKKARDAFLGEVKIGDVLEGRVTRLMPYGAFVALSEGVEGMIHLSELSWSRVEKPSEVIDPEDLVTVKIIGMEQVEKTGQMKIALSLKQVTGDPWKTVEETFSPGQKVMGKVTRCAKFGAFVEIAPGIEGLVHISEMSYRKRIVRPEDVVGAGEVVSVMIKEISPDTRRISLSIKDVEGDPWVDVEARYQTGQSVEGRIEKKESFGYFVSLEPGLTGLLPKSSIEKSPEAGELGKLKEGDSMQVIVQNVDAGERKISLAPGDSGSEANWHAFADTGRTMGSLGDKLQRAFKDKRQNHE
jgi:small subunit ribosomal protein S1